MTKLGGSTEELNEGGLPGPSEPGIYNARLDEISTEDFTSNSDEVFENPFRIFFTLKDSEGNEYQFSHMEFAPREDEDETKIQNKANRLLHLVKEITGRNMKFNDEEWTDAIEKVKKALDQYCGKNSPELCVKILGNVYNGKARLQIPGYLPFIKRKEESDRLFISKNEKKKNEEYLKEIQDQPDKEEDDLVTGSNGTDDSIPDDQFGGEQAEDDDPFS